MQQLESTLAPVNICLLAVIPPSASTEEDGALLQKENKEDEE